MVSLIGHSQAVSIWECPVMNRCPPSGSGAISATRAAKSALDSRICPSSTSRDAVMSGISTAASSAASSRSRRRSSGIFSHASRANR